MSESGNAVHPPSVHGGHPHSGRGAPDLPAPAHEHLGHHSRSGAELAGGNGSRHDGHGGHGGHHRTGSSGSVGGSRHGGKSSTQHFKRAGTVVRTIRTLKRKPKAAAQPSGASSPDAAGGGGPGGASGEAAAGGEGQPLLEEGGGMETASSAPAAISTGWVLMCCCGCCGCLLTARRCDGTSCRSTGCHPPPPTLSQ